MVVLVDTNVIIDVLQDREPFVEQSSKVIELCSSHEIKGYMAFHSVSNIFFILRKEYSNAERRDLLKTVLDILEVTGTSHDQVLNAVDREDFDDFEDCLQDECAKYVEADYIITRNTADFEKADVMALTPEEFLVFYNNMKKEVEEESIGDD